MTRARTVRPALAAVVARTRCAVAPAHDCGDQQCGVLFVRFGAERRDHRRGDRLIGATEQEAGLGHLELRVPSELDRYGVGVAAAGPRHSLSALVELPLPPPLEVAGEPCTAIGHGHRVYGATDPRGNSARIGGNDDRRSNCGI